MGPHLPIVPFLQRTGPRWFVEVFNTALYLHPMQTESAGRGKCSMTSLPNVPRRVLLRMIPQGYYFPALLICLWRPRYGNMAWMPGMQNRN